MSEFSSETEGKVGVFFRYFKGTFSEGFVRLELAGKGSGEDLIVERGVEELEREKGPSRKLIRYFHGHNERGLAFSRFPERREHSGTSHGFCGIDLRGLVVVVVNIVSLCSERLSVKPAPHSSGLFVSR